MPVGGEADVRFRGVSEGVGAEVGEERAGGDVGERVGQVPRRHRQRLIDAVAARREHGLGDRLLELVDLVGDGPVAGNGVVDRVEPVGLDRQLAAVQRDHQFAEVLAFLPGLDHGRAAVDDDRLLQLGVAVAADHHVDARHGLGQAHVVAVGVAPVLAFLHAAVAERDDHIHLLRLAEDLHHLLGGLDGVGERHRTGAAGVEWASLPSTPKMPKRMPPRSITRWRRITPSLARRWRSASVASFAAKLVFEASTAGTRPALAATPMDLPRPSGPRSNSWLPKVVAS